MTYLRTAAQQALNALGCLEYSFCGITDGPSEDTTEAAITALKAALAEPVQEPVAWRWGYRSITTGEMDWRGYVEIAADPNLRSPAIIMQPLYAAPPQRKPLTEEEIKECERQAMVNGSLPFEQRVFFARAIERTHGIK